MYIAETQFHASPSRSETPESESFKMLEMARAATGSILNAALQILITLASHNCVRNECRKNALENCGVKIASECSGEDAGRIADDQPCICAFDQALRLDRPRNDRPERKEGMKILRLCYIWSKSWLVFHTRPSLSSLFHFNIFTLRISNRYHQTLSQSPIEFSSQRCSMNHAYVGHKSVATTISTLQQLPANHFVTYNTYNQFL